MRKLSGGSLVCTFKIYSLIIIFSCNKKWLWWLACLLICGCLQCRCFPAQCSWVWLLPLALPVFLGGFWSGAHLPAQPAVEGSHVSLGRCIWGECWQLCWQQGHSCLCFPWAFSPTQFFLWWSEWVAKGRSGWLLFFPFLLPYTKWWCFTGEAAPGRGSFSFGTGLSGRDVTWGSCPESMDQHLTTTMCTLLSKVSVPSASLLWSQITRNVHQCCNRWRGKNVFLWESEYKYTLGS